MADKKDKVKKEDPALKDVEPGGDADETPLAEAENTPPDPNGKPSKN